MHHIQDMLILVQLENDQEIVNSIVCLFISQVSCVIQGNRSLIHAYGSTTHSKYIQDPCTCACVVPEETTL